MQVLRTSPREHHDSGQVDWVPVYLCHLSLPTHIQAISLPKPCSWEKALRIMLTTVQRLIPAPWESWELLGAGRREVRRQKGGRRITWLLIEVTLVGSAEGVWCNWEMWGHDVSPLFLHLSGAVPGDHHSFKKCPATNKSQCSCYTLTRAKWRSGQSTDAVPGSISLRQR